TSSHRSMPKTTPIDPYKAEDEPTRCGTTSVPTTLSTSSATAPNNAAGSSARSRTLRFGNTADVQSQSTALSATPSRSTSGAAIGTSQRTDAVLANAAATMTPAPPNQRSPTNRSLTLRPGTCHAELYAYRSAPATPSPVQSRPISPTTDATRRLCSALWIASVTVVAASPVSPRLSTTRDGTSAEPADTKPTTATA